MAPAGSSSLTIRGPITRADLPELCERVRLLLGSLPPGEVACDVRRLTVDAVAVDALARLQLAARRRGCRLRLLGASTELRDLVAFMGLGDVLPVD